MLEKMWVLESILEKTDCLVMIKVIDKVRTPSESIHLQINPCQVPWQVSVELLKTEKNIHIQRFEKRNVHIKHPYAIVLIFTLIHTNSTFSQSFFILKFGHSEYVFVVEITENLAADH